MDLKVPVTIVDELEDEVIASTGLLDLASGAITQVQYKDYDVKVEGLPAEQETYDFTCGTLSNNGKDVEFRVEVDIFSGNYSVSANELLEIKVRAAKLFAGISGKDILEGSDALNKPAAKSARKPK